MKSMTLTLMTAMLAVAAALATAVLPGAQPAHAHDSAQKAGASQAVCQLDTRSSGATQAQRS